MNSNGMMFLVTESLFFMLQHTLSNSYKAKAVRYIFIVFLPMFNLVNEYCTKLFVYVHACALISVNDVK